MDIIIDSVGWQNFDRDERPMKLSKKHYMLIGENSHGHEKTLCGKRLPHPLLRDDGGVNTDHCERCLKIKNRLEAENPQG